MLPAGFQKGGFYACVTLDERHLELTVKRPGPLVDLDMMHKNGSPNLLYATKNIIQNMSDLKSA